MVELLARNASYVISRTIALNSHHWQRIILANYTVNNCFVCHIEMPGEEEVCARFIEYTKTITRQNAIHDERMLAAFFWCVSFRHSRHAARKQSPDKLYFPRDSRKTIKIMMSEIVKRRRWAANNWELWKRVPSEIGAADQTQLD